MCRTLLTLISFVLVSSSGIAALVDTETVMKGMPLRCPVHVEGTNSESSERLSSVRMEVECLWSSYVQLRLW